MIVSNNKPQYSFKHHKPSRMEINIVRLLEKCETLAKDLKDVNNWRLEKYADTLGIMLNELKNGPNSPDRDVTLEYLRRIEFIKNTIQTIKLPTISEKVIASQMMKPCVTGGSDQMEIKYRQNSKYSKDQRKELFGEDSTQNESEKIEDMDHLVKYHHDLQEKIANHMLDLTKSLKEQALIASQIVKKDSEVIDKSSQQVDSNEGVLKIESLKLDRFNKNACKCWIWFMIAFVTFTFVGMVLFMKVFKKKY